MITQLEKELQQYSRIKRRFYLIKFCDFFLRRDSGGAEGEKAETPPPSFSCLVSYYFVSRNEKHNTGVCFCCGWYHSTLAGPGSCFTYCVIQIEKEHNYCFEKAAYSKELIPNLKILSISLSVDTVLRVCPLCSSSCPFRGGNTTPTAGSR